MEFHRDRISSEVAIPDMTNYEEEDMAGVVYTTWGIVILVEFTHYK